MNSIRNSTFNNRAKAFYWGMCLALFLTLFGLSGCIKKPVVHEVSASQLVTKIAKRAQACWFKGKNAPFKNYRLAAEVNSYAGKPRFLIVPKKNPGGLPVLVVQAEKKEGKTKLQHFGPALSQSHGARLTKDIEKWSKGSAIC